MSKMAKRILEIYRDKRMKLGGILTITHFQATLGIDFDKDEFADALEELMKLGHIQLTNDKFCYKLIKY